MNRRSFLSTVPAIGLGSIATEYGTRIVTADATLAELSFDSTCSLLGVDMKPLIDESIVAVSAEPTAYNDDAQGGGDNAVLYPDGTAIPLVASAGGVVGFGAPVGTNDTDFRYGDDEFLLNVLDAEVGGGSVVFDEGHGQYYDTDEYSSFVAYAENNGYSVEATTDITTDLDGVVAAIVTTPEGSAFADDELSALTSFVDSGGALLLFGQSDYSDYDETVRMNAIADAVGAPFRFNDDQVFDTENNAGSDFVPTTHQFNESFEYFSPRDGLGLDIDPEKSYEVVVTSVADGDTVDVGFVNKQGQPEVPIRLLGADTPEKESNANAERPEEWEGIADAARAPAEAALYPDDSGSGSDGDDSGGDLSAVMFKDSGSLVNADGGRLADGLVVPVWAESTAMNTDEDSDGDAVSYENDEIPLMGVEGTVVASGSFLVKQLTGAVEYDNSAFMQNVFDAVVGSGSSVLWDEADSHQPHLTTAYFEHDRGIDFIGDLEDDGYTVQDGGESDYDASLEGLTTEDYDAVVINSPEKPFTDAELADLVAYESNGGVIFLLGQSDEGGDDATERFNVLLDSIGISFRFNDDTVTDEQHNAGSATEPLTGNFNTDEFSYFAARGDSTDSDGSGSSAPDAEYPYLSKWGANATAFAKSQLPVGKRLTLSFDPKADVYDTYGRVLGYLTYDANGDGSRDTLYNEALLSGGYARVYDSSFSHHDEFWAAEHTARENGTGVWAASNPNDSPSIRDGSITKLFFPKPADITTTSGPVSDERVTVFASDTAEQSGANTSYDDVPLAAVDFSNHLAYLGAPVISESYEQAEGYPVDTASYRNYAFVTDLVDELGERDTGTILIEGGHNQFNLGYSLSAEDAAYYQRFLEGRDTQFEQISDVTTDAASQRLHEARGLIITTPKYAFTNAELAAVKRFTANGGVVVLMGSASASSARCDYLNDVAASVGTDLRLDSGRVVDSDSNLNDDETVLTTTDYTAPTPSKPSEPAAGTVKPSATDTTVGERLSFRVQDTSGNDRWIKSLRWDLGDGTSASGWYVAHRYDEAGTYTVTLITTDNTGTETTDTAEISVSDLSNPIARVKPSTTHAETGDRVPFQVNDTSGNDRWIKSLEWNLGDGTSASGWYVAHRYESMGTYTVTLTATDNTGHSTTDSVDLTVS